MKPSNLAQLACSLKDIANEHFKNTGFFDDHFNLHDYQPEFYS